MTNSNNLYDLPKENYKKVEEVREIEEVQLPNLSEITDESGKVNLPSELVAKLRDPNARFGVNVTVFTIDSQALMIAGSQSIVSRIERDFPKVAELLR